MKWAFRLPRYVTGQLQRVVVMRMGVLVGLVGLLVAGSIGVVPPPAAQALPAWWNASYSHRYGIHIQTGDALVAGYTLSVVIPHSTWVTAGTSLANGNDVRVVYQGSGGPTELHRVLGYGSGWNQTGTKLTFKTVNPIAANTSNDEYVIYYGNAAASTPPANPDNVYLLWDDFSTNTIGTKWWRREGTDHSMPVNVTGGKVHITGTTTDQTYFLSVGIGSNANFGDGFITEGSFAIIDQPASSATAWTASLGLATDHLVLHGRRWEYYESSWQEPVPPAPSSWTQQEFGEQRFATSYTSNTVKAWENGVFRASRTGTLRTDRDRAYLMFSPSVNAPTGPIDVTFDDITVRRYVNNEPSVSIAQSSETVLSASVAAALRFNVTGSSATCNGAMPDASVTSSATTLDFGAFSTAVTRTGAQHLEVSTNAANGYSLNLRKITSFASSVRAITDVIETGGVPSAFPGSGTEAFGYTTDAASGNITQPSAYASGKWAKLESTDDVIAQANGPRDSATTCVAYRLQTTATTPAGTYGGSALYTVIPGF